MPDGVDVRGPGGDWNGATYYGRPQLKPAPFDEVLVGTYVFLAGLSGGALLLATLLDLTRGREAASAVRRGRYLAMLAPSVGAACLVADLHTPRRFYNMLRVFKHTSPMSLGSWLLVAFSGASGMTAAAQFLSDRVRGLGWLRWIARVTQVPGAILGAGMATYTAALLSATSTPLWAAAPRALGARFASASIASAAAAMGLGERRGRIRNDLDGVAVAALAAELAATLAAEHRYDEAKVMPASAGVAGELRQLGGSSGGSLLPLALQMGSLMIGGRSQILRGAASLAILGGSLAMRFAVIAAGAASASQPEVSLRFARRQIDEPAA